MNGGADIARRCRPLVLHILLLSFAQSFVGVLPLCSSRRSPCLCAPLIGPSDRPSHVRLPGTERHSYRSAVIGSARVARRAGSQQAAKATATSRTATALKVIGSNGPIPKS